jgi:hypothetical protein
VLLRDVTHSNTQLRTRLAIIERDLSPRDFDRTKISTKMLVLSMRDELEAARKQVKALRRDRFHSNLAELQAQLAALQEEVVRLRAIAVERDRLLEINEQSNQEISRLSQQNEELRASASEAIN